MVLQGKVSDFDQRQRWGKIVPFGLEKGVEKKIMFFFPDQRAFVRDENGRESIDPNRLRIHHVQKGDHIFFEPGPVIAGMQTASVWALDRKPKEQEVNLPEPVPQPQPVVRAPAEVKNPDQTISVAKLLDTSYPKGGVGGVKPEKRRKVSPGRVQKSSGGETHYLRSLSNLKRELGNKHIPKPAVQVMPVQDVPTEVQKPIQELAQEKPAAPVLAPKAAPKKQPAAPVVKKPVYQARVSYREGTRRLVDLNQQGTITLGASV